MLVALTFAASASTVIFTGLAAPVLAQALSLREAAPDEADISTNKDEPKAECKSAAPASQKGVAQT